ncbi:hypothetical protein P8452_78057 [Trifolium repens]|nr:hypothetical protein P8452_78057 [Trifolium repens]
MDEEISLSLCCALWGNNDCDYVCLPAVGNSGGIRSLWRKSLGNVVFTIKGEGFVGVCLDLADKNVRCCMINIYAKCNLADKRRLWSDLLMTKRGFGDMIWCLTGDFNSVLDPSERRGVTVNMENNHTTEMREFSLFMEELELVDLPITGRQFTWFHSNGFTMSRLDRVMVSTDWPRFWGNPTVWVGPRDVSDHRPLILRYDTADWGPKPFRFNNFWLKHRQFRELGISTTVGPAERKKLLVDQIKQLDLLSITTGLSVVEVETRRKLFDELWVVLKAIDVSIFQRSRSKWLKEGDANTQFFHAQVKSRGRRNNISGLLTENGWVEGPSNVRQATELFFQQHFSSNEWNRPTLDGVDFPVLSDDSNNLLIAPFTMEEIEVVVKECEGSKCPGPDGFNFAFIKEFWDLMKHEVRIFFDQFHGIDCVPNCLLSYFITLIPKIKSPQHLGDFRPISLLGCWYKLLSKVLAGRLARVIGSLIPKYQSAFLEGGQLVEGVVVVNEVIDYAKKAGKECLILKVDFEKAYDSVDWGFLDYMLGRFGFCSKWRLWMKGCVYGGNVSVLVNGCPTKEISIKRGLKQGDPLAPLLFLLVAEGLGGLMRRAVEVDRFRPFLVGGGEAPVSLLQYADDTLCIGEATVENLWVLKAVLRGFEMSSGLKVNFSKSCVIGVNISNEFLGMASEFLNCRIGRTPFKYLGLPVGASPRNMNTWEPMLDSIRSRLGSWRNKYVWYALTKWLGIYLIVPSNISLSFAMWANCVTNKKQKAVMCLIWSAFMWTLWRVRNDLVFNNKVINIEEIVDRIKLVSWQWFIGRLAKSPCLLYEWEWSPIDCMSRC